MSGPAVTCDVDTCTHWLSGNVCGADNIDILHEEEGKMAETAEHTECKTFYRRGGVSSMLGSLDNVNWGGALRESIAHDREMTPSVTCIVDTCRFWRQGDLCEAVEIKVGGRGADECQDTNCVTFETAH